MDFGLYVHRNAEALLERGWGPYFYIPKLESHHEAALWRDAFVIAEDALGLERGTIKATVLIETIPAAFCMDAILYELRDHAAGLNAGRWDYIFSVIKRFRSRPEFVLPDRSEVTMTVPFMKAYSDLVVKTSHARGAHAMGGMAAVIPSRTDEEANRRAFEAVRADKEREANDGFDGTWVAHPDSVPVAMEAFDAVLGRAAEPGRQAARRRDAVRRRAPRRGLHPGRGHGRRTALERERRDPVPVLLAARKRSGCDLRPDGGRRHCRDRARPGLAVDPPRGDARRRPRDHSGAGPRARGLELEKIRSEIGDDEWFEREGRPELSRSFFERVALSEDFIEFLTLPAYEELLRLEH